METGAIVLLEWQNSKRIENYSLGLFYIYEALEQAEFDVKLLITDEKSVERIKKQVLEFNPVIIAIKYYGEQAGFNLKIAAAIKQANPGIKIIMGGHTASLFCNLILKQSDAVDFITRNESELTYVELCDCILNNLDYQECTGITYRDMDRIYKNTDREQIRDLQSLQMPRYSLFKNNNKSNIFYYAMSTARGCVGNCIFCTANNMHKGKGRKRWRGITGHQIYSNIKSLIEMYPDKLVMINFLDSAFEDPYPITKDRMLFFTNLLIENKCNAAYSIYSRAESWSDKDEDLITLLRKSGLNKVNIGFDETISIKNDVRFADKVVTEQNSKLVKLFEKNGIMTTCYFLLFYPFVSLDDLILYTEFLKNIKRGEHPDVWTHKLVLYPDSVIFSHVAKAGLLLGFDEEKYTFQYAYEDGRVSVLSRLMDKVSEQKNYIRIRDAMIKSDKILEFLNAAKICQYSMEVSLKEVEEFYEDLRSSYYMLGNDQAELFSKMINCIKHGQKFKQDRYLEKWNQIYERYAIELERKSMCILMKLTRKKVILF